GRLRIDGGEAHRRRIGRGGGRRDRPGPDARRARQPGTVRTRIPVRTVAAKEPGAARRTAPGRCLLHAGHCGGQPLSIVRTWLASLPGYLWSGWGAVASLLLMMAGW